VSTWKARAEDAEADLASCWKAREQAEAELAELKGQKCETCDYPVWYETGGYGGHCMWVSHIHADFSCCKWTARAEEGTSEDTYAGQCWGGADTPDERARTEEGK